MKKNETSRNSKVSGREHMFYGVLILMVVVCVLIFVSAFIDNTYSNHKIISLITKFGQLWGDNLPHDFEKISNSFIEKLKAAANCSMESNTVTFLLTLLSVGVIGYAVHLIESSHKKMLGIEKRIAKIETEKVPEAENKLTKLTQDADFDIKNYIRTSHSQWKTIAWLSKAKILCDKLQQGWEDKDILNETVPQLRDILFFTHVELEDIIKRTGPIMASQRLIIQEEIQNLKLNIEGMPDSCRDFTKDLIDYCNKILDLLKD